MFGVASWGHISRKGSPQSVTAGPRSQKHENHPTWVVSDIPPGPLTVAPGAATAIVPTVIRVPSAAVTVTPLPIVSESRLTAGSATCSVMLMLAVTSALSSPPGRPGEVAAAGAEANIIYVS